MDESVFDVLVVGAGLFGSAAAKHLALLRPDLRLGLIGPGEPGDRADTDIFGCWHDEGRLYHAGESGSNLWGKLSRESIKRFDELSKLSDIDFYHECGYMKICGPMFAGFKDWLELSKMSLRGESALLSPEEVGSLLPFLSLAGDSLGYWEPPGVPGEGAGHLSPRLMVTAQQRLARAGGCHIIRELAVDLVRLDTGDWEVVTRDGARHRAHKVILCQGTELGLGLLGARYLPPLDVWFTAQTVALMEIDSDEASRLARMPSMVIQTDPKVYTYILPPIRYPDGRTYLKFGQHDLTRELRTRAEITSHYRAGPEPGHVSQLVDQAGQLLPGLRVISYTGDSCVTLNTPTKEAPFIDDVLPGLVIAGAGCGHGAQSCDEIGRLAAVLGLTGAWDSDLQRERCRVRFKPGAKL